MLFCLFQRKSITANNATSNDLQTAKGHTRFGNAASRIPVSGIQVHHGQTIVVDDGTNEHELSAFGEGGREHPFAGGIKVDPRHYLVGTDEEEDEKAGGRAGRFDAV